MSELVCYIDRAERGMLPVRLRLVSTRVDQTWAFPDVQSDDRAALERGLREAADWIAAQLKAANRSALGAIVLDTDGARCGWVGTHTVEPDTIDAALRQAIAPGGDDDGAGVESAPHVALTPDMQINGVVSVQPLSDHASSSAARKPAQPGEQQRFRVGVTVVPDATARMLLDELDARGVTVRRVVSVWHALAESFGDGMVGRAERVIASSDGTTAQAVVDPEEGRLVWVWSRDGSPIAAGAFRLARGTPPDRDASAFVLTASDLARLASEWLAWSTQLAASPMRVRVMLPDWAWQDEASLGGCVASVWPGATTDLATEDDPVGHLLARFADGLGDAAVSATSPALEQLQGRPGRPHRAMYQWAAAAVAAGALGMGAGAFHVNRAARAATSKAEDARTAWRAQAGELSPQINEGPFVDPVYDARAEQDLRDALASRRKAVAPLAIAPPKPILRELETLSFVLGNPEYEVRSISFSEFDVSIDVLVPDTAAYEELVDSLERIGGSAVMRWDKTPKTQGDSVSVKLSGQWATPGRSDPGGA